MRCEACHGSGHLAVATRAWTLPGAPRILIDQPCTTCNGSGVSHCCEGDRACPDAATTPPKDTPDAG